MKKVFKLEDGTLVDPIKHTIDFLKNYPDAKIYIGTDSQNKRYQSAFVTTIGYKMGSRGMHCIYRRENLPKQKDKYTRLWKEVEMSVEIAKLLEENGFKITCVELDFNKKEIAKSNTLVSAAKGYVIGSGFDCNVKPDMQSAVRFSDHKVRQ